MKIKKANFNSDYYKLWQLGLHIPEPSLLSIFSVKYRKNNFDQYSRVTLKALNVNDALERACYAICSAGLFQPEEIDLHAVYDAEENLLWIDEPFYNVVQKRGEFRGMERRDFLLRFGATSAAILFGIVPFRARAGSTSVALSGTASSFAPPPGEQLYTTVGSFTWTVPAGVTSACVVCVGAGGSSGGGGTLGGGGGGALVYKNAITVTPAAGLPVVVGGSAHWVNGDNTTFNTTLIANGGVTSGTNAGGGGGSYSGGDGGGNGGNGGFANGATNPGGGGAGGYTGSGGAGGASAAGGVSSIGGGGGGGGGNNGGSGGFGGGGVGLYGSGADGLGGAVNNPGIGGSGGTTGGQSTGGAYGGGGGGAHTGTKGAVRIMWGAGRSFPSSAA